MVRLFQVSVLNLNLNSSGIFGDLRFEGSCGFTGRWKEVVDDVQ